MNTMIYDKIINKLNGIQEKFAYNIKNILLNGIASSVFLPPQTVRKPQFSTFQLSVYKHHYLYESSDDLKKGQL